VELVGNFFVDGSFGRQIEFCEHFGELVLGVNVRLEKELHARAPTPLEKFDTKERK